MDNQINYELYGNSILEIGIKLAIKQAHATSQYTRYDFHDILQESLLTVLEALDRIDYAMDENSIAAYLKSCIRHSITEYIYRNKNCMSTSRRTVDIGISPLKERHDVEQYDIHDFIISDLIDNSGLTDTERKVILLLMEGYTHACIAREVSMSASNISRLKQVIKDKLIKGGLDDIRTRHGRSTN